jgi:serine/threonine protein kinase
MEQLKPAGENGAATGAPVAIPDRPPERVGEYRILREIGRGGMGVVYEAEQEALGRRVAIKVLPRHLLANERLRARFRREAHLAAQLHHTNIVPVFAVGESGEQCFYVMQRIEGRSLDQVIADLRFKIADLQINGGIKGPAGETRPTARAAEGFFRSAICNLKSAIGPQPPRDRAYVRAMAELGIQVADALAYAHAQGVLHRDIKPSNLLLDDAGAVWVTDFGVAKMIEEANLTQSGDFVGTLKYMPPERFSGQSDGRGDVYSLGVTLYELLTLRPAFPDTTPQHLIQLITQEATIRPRKLNPEIPRDLETIVRKAAARDPAQRYQTPGELADELRRFLDDRPILARRTGLMEQAWRWCRRNPALGAVTATALLLMVAVTVISIVASAKTAAASRETARANEDMENALAAEKAQREQAETASTLALDALNRIYNRFAPTRLVATPQALNDQGVELPPQPALPPEAISLLEDLLRTYEQIARSAGAFPRLHGQAAEANHRIGDIRQRLGRYEEAAAAYRVAIDLYREFEPEAVEDTLRIKLARAFNELGRTLRALQRPEEADPMYQKAIQTLVEAPKDLAERPEYRYELARASFLFGQRDQLGGPPGPGPDRPPRRGLPGRGPPHPFPEGNGRRGPPPPGGPHGPPHGREGDHPAQRAASLLEQLVQDFPSVPEYRHLLACCYRDLPPGRVRRGSPSSKVHTDRAVELLQQLVAEFPRVPDYRLDLCETLARPGLFERAGEANADSGKRQGLEKAITLSGQLLEEYSNVPDYAAAHARYLHQLGMALFQDGQPDDAEKPIRKALAIQQRLVEHYPEVAAFSFWLSRMDRSLGRILIQRGAWQEARSWLESAVNRLEALRKKNPHLLAVRPLLSITYRELARALTGSGETALATEALHKAGEFDPDRAPDPSGSREGRHFRP